MGTHPDPGGRGAAAPAMGSFQLEDFAAGWIGGELTLEERDPQRRVCFRETAGSERLRGGPGAAWAEFTSPAGDTALSAGASRLRPGRARRPAPGVLRVTGGCPRELREPHRGSPELRIYLQVRRHLTWGSVG